MTNEVEVTEGDGRIQDQWEFLVVYTIDKTAQKGQERKGGFMTKGKRYDDDYEE